MIKIAILYSELAAYSMACFKELSNRDVQLLLVHWPINPEAPFQFDFSFCQAISKDSLNRHELNERIIEFNPELILASGWMDKDYVNVCRNWFGKIPTVLSLDNHWTGSLKQRIATLVSPCTLRKTFSHAFVPGKVQFEYARKLGFPEASIQRGFYSADNQKFIEYGDAIENDQRDISKRFIYLGRYAERKGVFDLWEAFVEFQKTHPDWELWCVGTGDQFENRIESIGIKHFGFVQPSELLPILMECSVYILPSHFEPWGVSVQEMAIAGFPLLLSDQIGSNEAFLNDGVNGFSFKSGDSKQLQERMEQVSKLSDKQFNAMKIESRKLGLTNSPNTWSKRLLNFLNEK